MPYVCTLTKNSLFLKEPNNQDYKNCVENKLKCKDLGWFWFVTCLGFFNKYYILYLLFVISSYNPVFSCGEIWILNILCSNCFLCQCWEKYTEKKILCLLSAIHKSICYINSHLNMQPSSFYFPCTPKVLHAPENSYCPSTVSSNFQNLFAYFSVHIPLPSRIIKEQVIRKPSLQSELTPNKWLPLQCQQWPGEINTEEHRKKFITTSSQQLG